MISVECILNVDHMGFSNPLDVEENKEKHKMSKSDSNILFWETEKVDMPFTKIPEEKTNFEKWPEVYFRHIKYENHSKLWLSNKKSNTQMWHLLKRNKVKI